MSNKNHQEVSFYSALDPESHTKHTIMMMTPHVLPGLLVYSIHYLILQYVFIMPKSTSADTITLDSTLYYLTSVNDGLMCNNHMRS